MISNFSTLLTKKLSEKGVIQDEDYELYEYAFFMISSYIFFLVTAIVVGLLTNIPLSSFVFYVSFCVVRNFAGGVHADSESKCLIFTTASVILSIIIIKTLIDFNCLLLPLLMMLFSIIILILLSPVDTHNKKLSSQERTIFRRKTIILVTLIVCVFFIMLIMKIINIAIALSVAMALAAILVLIGKIKPKIENCKKKSA